MNKVGPDTMVIHYVYILECRNGMLYTGYTNNIERRIAEHKRGTASKFTRSRLPVTLSYLEPVDNKTLAIKREIRIKHLSRIKKIELCKRYGKRKLNK